MSTRENICLIARTPFDMHMTFLAKESILFCIGFGL